MNGLSSLLEDPSTLTARLKVSAPEPLALRRTVRSLAAVEGGETSTTDVAALQARVALLAATANLKELSRRELRECCRLFLHPPRPPGHQRDVAQAVIGEVQLLKRRAAFFALIDVYLDRFDPEDDHLAQLATELSRVAETWPWRSTDLWPARTAEFSLFDATRAPNCIAEAVLGSEEPPVLVLERAGLLTDGRRKGGMGEAAFGVAAQIVAASKGRAAQPMQLRLIEWARLDGTSYSYPRVWADYARALFLPWKLAEPEPEHRGVLIDAAVGYAGDPRVQQGRWRAVQAAASEAYDIVVRWLTKASVEQFFDIVAQTTDRPDMWSQRRKFWTAYLKADAISAAWVAFGADGARRAELASRTSGDAGLTMFGRLGSGGGRTSEHAALIMRMGDLTIVEWSHNGRWNIWRRGDPNHPELFRHNNRRWIDYEPRELMNGPLWGAHQGDWQSTVREIIRRETGVRP